MTHLEKTLTWKLEAQERAAAHAVEQAQLTCLKQVWAAMKSAESHGESTLRWEALLTNMGAQLTQHGDWTFNSHKLNYDRNRNH